METPRSLSSSALILHCSRRYGKFVNVDCHVPIFVARDTLLLRSSSVSSSSTMTSDRLQNPILRNRISAQGLVPLIREASLRSGTCSLAPARLNIPRSPDPDATSAAHSVSNWPLAGLLLYTAELFERARWGLFTHQA